VYAALGVWSGDQQEERQPDTRRGEGIGPVAVAATYAVRDPGTEVSATQIAGQARGPRGRWAKLLRRPRLPLLDRQQAHDPVPGPAGESKATPPAADQDPAARHTIDTD